MVNFKKLTDRDILNCCKSSDFFIIITLQKRLFYRFLDTLLKKNVYVTCYY